MVLATFLGMAGTGLAATQASGADIYYAVVNASGKAVHNVGVQSSKRQDVGRYRLQFAKSVAECAVTATLRGTVGGQVSVQQQTNSPQFVRVYTFSHNGTPVNSAFVLQVTCGAGGAPVEGQLVITEIMANPGAVLDSVGEWFEVRNVSAGPLSLLGLTLATAANSVTVDTEVIVPAGGFVVLGRNGDPSVNGGIPVNYVYGDGLPLPNSGLVLTISRDGQVIDLVSFPGFVWPSGKSLSLDPSKQTATGNDDAANWCLSASALPSGDFGTPGQANPSCP